jgi:hypothetical protein
MVAGASWFWCAAQGTGDLEGMKYFPKNIPLDYIPDGDPCPEPGATAASLVNAILLDTRGE